MSPKHPGPSIAIKRVYDPVEASDGRRFLAERLWPRGVKKESLKLDGWLREVAPSTKLRQWFSHDLARWEEFQRRYRAELDSRPKEWRPILDAAGAGAVTLLFSSRDAEHNNVVALRAYLLAQRVRRPSAATTSGGDADPARAAHDRPRGFSSPPCYLSEFEPEDP